MSRFYLVTPIPPLHIIDGLAFNTFTAYQDISPAPAVKIPSNLLEPGTRIKLEAKGEFSNTGTPTLSLGFFWGAASVPLGQSSAITTTTAAASWPWQLEYDGTVRSVGATGSIQGQGRVEIGTSLVATTSQFTPTTLALRTSAIDTSIEKVVGVAAAWSASSVSNTIKTTMLSIILIS